MVIHLLSYVLWNCAICWKFPKITSLLSRTTLGTAGLSIVFIYLSTTACRSRPNSSSVSTSSRMTALEWKIYEFTDIGIRNENITVFGRQRRLLSRHKLLNQLVGYPVLSPGPNLLSVNRFHRKVAQTTWNKERYEIIRFTVLKGRLLSV